jgi:hypothetical protein
MDKVNYMQNVPVTLDAILDRFRKKHCLKGAHWIARSVVFVD